MTEDTAAGGELVKRNGWQQGSFLDPESFKTIATTSALDEYLEDNLVYIVLSHDCDVSHPSLEVEPSVDILIGQVADKVKKEIYHGRSTRLIQFPAIIAGNEAIIQFSIHDLIQIPREHLQNHKPAEDYCLKDDGVRELALWYVRRYTRFGFPDSLVNRLKKAERKIREKLKKQLDVLSGIYILTDQSELPENEPYNLVVWGVVKKSVYDTSDLRQKAQEALNFIEEKFSQCSGVEVKEADLLSEEQVTLHSLHSMNRWDLDDLSVRSSSLEDIGPK